MSDLLCPDCGHTQEHHSVIWTSGYGRSPSICAGEWPYCKCQKTPSQVIFAAQRAAAIAHLRQFVEKETWVSTKGVKMPAHGTKHFEQLIMEIWMMADAYRAVGILRERK